MANVDVSGARLLPQAGAGSDGTTIVLVTGETKAAQNDTITFGNNKEVVYAVLSIDATGASETNTISSNVITLTSATTGTVSGIVVVK